MPAQDQPDAAINPVRQGAPLEAIECADVETVCDRYWRPLHAFLLSCGHSPADADDLTQEFFARLIEKQWLAAFDANRGRLVSFLLVMLKRFLANEWDKQHCQKRGGGIPLIQLDALHLDERNTLEPIDPTQPDTLYDYQRTAAAVEEVVAEMRVQALAQGKGDKFDLLEPTLFGEPAPLPYAALAAHLEMTESGVKSLVHRLRHQLKAELLKRPIEWNKSSEPSRSTSAGHEEEAE